MSSLSLDWFSNSSLNVDLMIFFIFYCQGSIKFADIRALQRPEMPKAGAKYILALVPWLYSVISGHFHQFHLQICWSVNVQLVVRLNGKLLFDRGLMVFYLFYCQGSFKFADIRALQQAEMPRAGAKYILASALWLYSVNLWSFLSVSLPNLLIHRCPACRTPFWTEI